MPAKKTLKKPAKKVAKKTASKMNAEQVAGAFDRSIMQKKRTLS